MTMSTVANAHGRRPPNKLEVSGAGGGGERATRREWLPGRDGALLGIYTLTIFLNAGLLFLIQPMFSRMVLPLFGGSASTWTACMLFFQTALLAGYLYAHVMPRWLGIERHAWVHIALLVISLLTLPIAAQRPSMSGPQGHPLASLLVLLTVSLGAPFFLLSSGGPLLQRWFSRTHHASAGNPYFLYAASNLGSMLALLAYPLILEPWLRLPEQSAVWTSGYMMLTALTVSCLILMRPGRRAAAEVGAERTRTAPSATTALPWTLRLRWAALAFVPSSLLLGVTAFLTTDIAPIPLLWVLPLALYLLTFVIAFARRQFISQRALVRVQPFLLLPLIVNMAVGMTAWPAAYLPFHVAAFVLAALICHMQLAAQQPAVEHLTEFYLWISVGGMLGGVFNVLIAPLVFSSIAEYPIGLVLAALLRPTEPGVARSSRGLDLLLPIALGAACFALLSIMPDRDGVALVVAGSLAAVVVFSFNRRPLRFALGLGALLLAGELAPQRSTELLAARSFFGVHRVERDPDGYHLLIHGSTVHGAQNLSPQHRLEPLTYYSREAPVGQLFAQLPARAGRSVAVIGLGSGTMTCYGRPGERWTYYEIDPLVERIARDRRYFSWLSDCPVQPAVVLGDARLRLAEAPAGRFDIIVVDAFSSDAIPVHLLTREAVALYLDKLAPGGVVIVHISNRYLDPQPVFARLARDLQLAGRYQRYSPAIDRHKQYTQPSAWLVLARTDADLGAAAHDSNWRPLAESAHVGVWTDDFSNLLSILSWRHRN